MNTLLKNKKNSARETNADKDRRLKKEMKELENLDKKEARRQINRTKRAIAKEKRKAQDQAIKSISRNAAVAATTVSANLAEVEKKKADAQIAKYNAIISGNIAGENAVDDTKPGTSPGQSSNSTTAWEGW